MEWVFYIQAEDQLVMSCVASHDGKLIINEQIQYNYTLPALAHTLV